MDSETIINTTIEEYEFFTLFAEDTAEVKTNKRVRRPREECVYKQQFEICVQDECQQAIDYPTHISINQAYLLLFKKYMEWKVAVPKNHRNHVGERGHLCIWHALENLYLQLKRAELMLVPQMLFLPQPPPAATPALALPSRLERALEEYTIGEILGEEVADD